MDGSQGKTETQDVDLAAVFDTISADRLSTYLIAKEQNLERAIALYVWNSRASESLHLPLQTFEVCLRNAVSLHLEKMFGPNWPSDQTFLAIGHTPGTRNKKQESIQKAISRIQASGKAVTTPRIVAALSLEFWANLLSKAYERALWIPHIKTVSPHSPRGTSRAGLQSMLIRTKELRNRVAHYEPIFDRDLSIDHTTIVRLITYRCPATANWLASHDIFQKTLRERP